MKRKPTMKDVAQYAGVSTATVARVIHENGYVSEEAEKKVREAISEVEYSLNTIAQSLRQQRTNVIGHILQSTVPNPFFMHVALGVESYARERGFSVLTYNVLNNAEHERRAVETFVARRVDAILFTVPMAADNILYALEAGVPVVQIERPKTVETDYVIVDNYSGSVAAMTHLIDLGHRHIAFIGAKWDTDNPIHQYVEIERFSAYRDTLIDHNIAFDEELVALGRHYLVDNGGSLGDGVQFAEQMLRIQPRPTAILAGSDMTAIGILQTIYRHRLHVPDDISVIGFDDTLASFLTPPLTTVGLPMQQLGSTAAEIAIKRLDRDDDLIHTPKLQTELVIRESTGPAPR